MFTVMISNEQGTYSPDVSFPSYATAFEYATAEHGSSDWYISGPPAKPLQDQLQHKIDQLYLR